MRYRLGVEVAHNEGHKNLGEELGRPIHSYPIGLPTGENRFDCFARLVGCAIKELTGKVWIADASRDYDAHERNHFRVEKILIKPFR